jgi:xylan 1,4-beta-xylosidase
MAAQPHPVPAKISISLEQRPGSLRPLHGINKGPIAAGGTIDLTAEHRALAIPFTRLHDCQWPYPDVVDFHAIFRNPDADPGLPESYDFKLTDEYLAAVHRTGAKMVYRLGESIEHMDAKRFVHPPGDMARWTDACLGIIRHYNNGWVNGFKYDIEYWEIWNEPENRPAMWTGSDQEYFRLYQIASTVIKKAFPKLKVGGPGVGHSGSFQNALFSPSAFVTDFLKTCRTEALPLDFFSWHCYTDDPHELVARVRAIRQLLDAHGFGSTESHLNEWNYLPGKSWSPLSRNSPAQVRQSFYREMAGARGAAFIAASLILLQDEPIDMCNLFHGEIGGFGLFNEFGIPGKNYYAVLAFQKLLGQSKHRLRVAVESDPQLFVAAGSSENQDAAALLISDFRSGPNVIMIDVSAIPWAAGASYELHLLDELRPWQMAKPDVAADARQLTAEVHSPAVVLLKLLRKEL